MANFFTDLNNFIKQKPLDYMREFGIEIEPNMQIPCPICGGENRFNWRSTGKYANTGYCRSGDGHGGNVLQPLTIIQAITKFSLSDIGAHLGFNKTKKWHNPNHLIMRNAPKQKSYVQSLEPLSEVQLNEFNKIASQYFKNATYKESPYLLSKGISKMMWVTGHDKTLLPYSRNGKISALQALSKDGKDKNLIKYSQGSGAYYAEWMPNVEIRTIFIGEGLATVCAIQETLSHFYHGSLFVTSRSANNLYYVASELRCLFPTVPICVLTDNDESNAGLKATKKTIENINNCWWAMPVNFGEDWCDVFQRGKSFLHDEFRGVLTNSIPTLSL
ncbi:TPA: toprim domain-containing protein [Enterobacter hormaechei subsp. xiangfangensis]|nr:toprim domain-containing protein [Enterobacter hormaechei]EHN8823517.1 toprim domain-containing protein [Enterobacter hormaechei]HCM9365968.1 toprim domain-containing protein [Enterobacter hormaechei subsp. xiangfangensis]HCM9384026.1 toprim domain-containing protein [Enterobacter hormaechei subsp. xiangfangensis]HCM9694103.1 toprim domain-containing protein [Enterobacter hormaechei subsp. xiangfangensis]